MTVERKARYELALEQLDAIVECLDEAVSALDRIDRFIHALSLDSHKPDKHLWSVWQEARASLLKIRDRMDKARAIDFIKEAGDGRSEERRD